MKISPFVIEHAGYKDAKTFIIAMGKWAVNVNVDNFSFSKVLKTFLRETTDFFER